MVERDGGGLHDATETELIAARPEADVGVARQVGIGGVLAAVLGKTPALPVIGGFRLERKIGGGGMGAVYQAVEERGGGAVALKLMEPGGPDTDADRFFRETRILADLRHPAIVRYIAHGLTRSGEPYLAMELLDGEDLARRLRRGGLSVADAVQLAIRLAEALAEAHARGIVHRDLKPANVFLPGGRLDEAKLLDFGVAHRALATGARLTRTGALVGTPSYMAPEQARGAPAVDFRADLFALGCTLHECLTGRPPFVADQLLGLLARVLFEDPARIAATRGDVPPALDDLLARLLAKDPERRPASANAVAEELRALGPLAGGPAPPPPSALSALEQLVVTVVVIGDAVGSAEDQARLRARRGGALLERLTPDTLLAAIARGPAVDQAAAAARLALELAELFPHSPIAVATGRGVAGGVLPLGEAVDRGAEIMAAHHHGVWVDPVAGALLDGRFELTGAGRLVRARAAEDETRTLLGKVTPCVGREHELALLDGALADCIARPATRAVLVTAPPGAGKSRLAHEWRQRLAAGGAEPPRILAGRCEPMSAGAPHALAAQLVRRGLGLGRDATPEVLRAALAGTIAPAELARVSMFLGELVGLAGAEAAEELRAARGSPLLMGDQLRLAWEDWLLAEVAARPLVLLVDDLQWGDAPSVSLLGAALRTLADRPLLVVAFARREVHQLFPALWAERAVQEIRLPELSPRASEALVRAVLGPTVDAATVSFIGERAGGHALHLEEVIRAVAAGQRERVPASVLAMMQARLMALPGDARRVLRAGSIFGDVFWRGGVTALIGGDERQVAEALEELVARETISQRRAARFPGETEYGFRHALFREAAEAMLTEADRALGHRLAADWLIAAGERRSLLLAQHLEQGGDAGRAVGFYLAAAQEALQGNDFAGAILRAGSGLALLDADGEPRGRLHLVRGEAHAWRGDEAEAVCDAEVALDHLDPASSSWYAAVRVALTRVPARRSLLDRLVRGLAARPVEDARRSFVMAAVAASMQLSFRGAHDDAWELVVRAEAVATRLPPGDVVHGWNLRARASALEFEGRHDAALDVNLAASRHFEALGDLREACSLATAAGWLQATELGRHADAVRTLSQALELATRMGLSRPILAARQNLGVAFMRLGRLDEADALLEEAAREFGRAGDPRMEGGSRYYLTLLHTQRGDCARAEEQALAALELARDVPTTRACALAALARALLAAGRPAEALGRARAAAALLDELGAIEEGEGLIRLALAEALRAAGAHAEARAAIVAARARLDDRAGRIADAEVRRCFLAEVPEHAATYLASWDDLEQGR